VQVAPASQYPLTGESNISLLTNIRISFSTNVNGDTVNSGSFYITTNTDSSPCGIAANVVLSSSDSRTLFLTPANSLMQLTTYRAVLTPAVLTTSGAHFSNNYVWSFTTRAPMDNLVSRVPVPGSTNVSLLTDIQSIFPTPLKDTTVNNLNFYLSNSTYGIIEMVLSYNSATYGLFGKPATILHPFQTYTVYVTTNLMGINATSLVSNENWSFTTAGYLNTPTGLNPGVGQTNININTTVSAVFTGTIEQSSLNENTVFLSSTNGSNVAGTLSYNSAQRTLTYSPATYLDSEAWYTFTVSTNVRDTNGTYLSSPLIWTFKTIPPFERPTSVFPLPGTEFISPTVIVTAKFNEILLPSSVNAESFRIFQSGKAITGEVAYSEVSREISFTPRNPLEENETFLVTISRTITSLTGRSLKKDYAWEFKTGIVIGIDGGETSTANGVLSLHVPRKALDKDVLIRLESVEVPVNGLPGELTGVISSAYNISPDNITFNRPATATYNLNKLSKADSEQCTVILNREGTWTIVGGTRADTLLSFPVDLPGTYCLCNGSIASFDIEGSVDIYPRVLETGGEAIISFSTSSGGEMLLRLVTLEGDTIRSLGEGLIFTPGRNSVIWDGLDYSGNSLPSGLYVLFILNDQRVILYRRLIVIK
jgi:hypothetical protein